jgi:chemotaxis protein MotB
MAEQQPEVKIKFIKKKGGHGGGHSGGAWKVAYADLVTAMMAFFLLMWLLNNAPPATKAGIAGMFQDPNFFNTEKGKAILADFGKGILPGGRGMKEGPDGDQGGTAPEGDEAAAEKERKAMEETAQSIAKVFSEDQLLQSFKDQISFDFTEEGLRIQVQDKASSVLFDSGSASVKPMTLSILKEIATELGKLPNKVLVGGHTDSMRYPTQAYTNWELSADRANAARRIMESSGLHTEQVQKVTGYADTVPLTGKEANDPLNRRISIIVLSSATERADQDRQKSKGAPKTDAKGKGKAE